MKKDYFPIYLFIILYISLVAGFLLSEDFNGGAISDYKGYIKIASDFEDNFANTFLNYDKYGNRHSPLSIIILSQLIKLDIPDHFIRFLNLNVCLIIIFYFYKCLRISFSNINKFYLKIISIAILISPTFRALSIWPDSRIHGLLFFIISLYFFLKFKFKNKEQKNIILNAFFLVVSSYFSPNFSVFSLYFFYNFFAFYKFSKEIFIYILINLILCIPMLMYLLVFDVFFLSSAVTPGSETYTYLSISNLANKFLIISSIIFFYLIPFLITKKINKIFIINKKDIFIYVILATCFMISSIFFDYQINYTGGGIFYKISNYLFSNNYLFYLISFFSIYLVFYRYGNFNNLFIIFILFISNPQLTIYHKYYDPLLLILILTVFNYDLSKNYFKYSSFIYLYLFYFVFFGMSVFKVLYT